MLLDSLVIGSSVESVMYAFLSDSYFIPTSHHGPMFYEDSDFRVLPFLRKDELWSRMNLVMSLCGRLLFYENIESLSIVDRNIKIVSSEGVRKYNFGSCRVFDSTILKTENQIKKPKQHLYVVYDDFELSNLGSKHLHLEPKHSHEDLAKKINYYTSSRVDGANYVTDCVVESNLSKEQLLNFEYSDTMARFCVERHLTSIGVYGNIMGKYKNGKYKYRKPKIVHKKRVVVAKDQNVYKDSESVIFLDLTMEQIFDELSP